MQGQPDNFPNVPGYRLLEKLGEGGMGTVYCAAQIDPPRTVAIKVLNPLPGGHAPVGAFRRESGLMGALAHPGVVAIHDCGVVGGRLYLVMEYVAGPNLRALLQPGRPWPVAEAQPLLDRIAAALAYIHSQGTLHLDLKPENVLLGNREQGTGNREEESRATSGSLRFPVPCSLFPVPYSGSLFPVPYSGSLFPVPYSLFPKITDFGLAVPRGDANTLSELGLAQGTVDYCSPEQRHGLPTDVRSDLFALATLAYEVLTGQLPGRVFVPATVRNPVLPAAVDEVLRRGLARAPEDRYRAVEEFRAALNAALVQTFA